MILNKDEHPSIMKLLSVRGALSKGYKDDKYFYFCTEGESGNVCCQLTVSGEMYSILYNTMTYEMEVSSVCDKEAEEFLEHLRNKYFSIVDKTEIQAHPEDVYFEIDGSTVRMSKDMPGLRRLYPGANANSMIWEGSVKWRS